MQTMNLKIKISNASNGVAINSKTLSSAGNLSWNFLQYYKIQGGNVSYHTRITEAIDDGPPGCLIVGVQAANILGLTDGLSAELSLSNAPKATYIQVEETQTKSAKKSLPELVSGIEVTPGEVYTYEQQAVLVKSCSPTGSYLADNTSIETISKRDGEIVTSVQKIATKAGKVAGEGFTSLVGMDDVIEQVRQKILLPIQRPEQVAEFLGSPLKGAILHGPPGVAKTALARAIAIEAGIPFVYIPSALARSNIGPGTIIEEYEKASKRPQGGLIFFDEIDAVAPRDAEYSIVTTTIQECMDGFKRQPKVFTLAATNHLENVADPLLRGGRFDLIIDIKLPDVKGRGELFKHFTKGLRIKQPMDYRHLAEISAGYSGADIESLVKQAGTGPLTEALMGRKDAFITQQTLEACLAEHKPTGERIMGVTRPRVSFGDLYGIDKLVREITPILDLMSGKRKSTYSKVKNMSILLYGPPGTGKTSFAQAIAHYQQMAFVARTGGSFKNKYVGESERNVRELFAMSRTYSPISIYIDEIDALGSRRGGYDTHGDKLLNEFLAEMQGVAENDGVLIIGATNRRDMLDDALLSRFSYQLEMPLPNCDERQQVLEGLFGKLPPEIVKIDYADIARLTDGRSQRDLAGMVNTCRMDLDLERVSVLTTNYLKSLTGSDNSPTIPEPSTNGVHR